MVMELEYDRSLYGKEHEAGPFEVTKEIIQAFSQSIGETGRTRFHAGQRVQAKASICAGDFLTASSHLKEVYPKTGRSGTMVFIVW